MNHCLQGHKTLYESIRKTKALNKILHRLPGCLNITGKGYVRLLFMFDITFHFKKTMIYLKPGAVDIKIP